MRASNLGPCNQEPPNNALHRRVPPQNDPARTSLNDTIIPIEDDIKACDKASNTTKKPLDPWSGDHIGFYHVLNSISRTGSNKCKRSNAAGRYYEITNRARPYSKILCRTLVNRMNLDSDVTVGVLP